MSKMKDLLMDLEDQAFRPDRPKRRRNSACDMPEEQGYPIRPYEPEDELKLRLAIGGALLLSSYDARKSPHQFQTEAPYQFLTIDDRKCGKAGLVKQIYGPLLNVAEELEAQNLKGAGILFYPNRTNGKTGRKECILFLRSFIADLDFKRATQEVYLDSILESVQPTPTAIVHTGNGRHLHWVFEDWVIATEDSIREHEECLRRIQAKLARMGADKGVCNVSACMRLPGFYNHKGAPILVKLEDFFGKRYSPEEIMQHYPPLPPKPTKRYEPPKDMGNLTAYERLRRASKYLAKLPPAIQGENGSRTTFIVAKKLLTQCGLSEKETYDLMRREYNRRCAPPWTDSELLKKVQDAAGREV
ncbi:MAG: RepB family DNA primase [Holophagales bacterium]|jgi:hypothetical protein|nr:RepB family DNA primase [Holophagales bacterium]